MRTPSWPKFKQLIVRTFRIRTICEADEMPWFDSCSPVILRSQSFMPAPRHASSPAPKHTALGGGSKAPKGLNLGTVNWELQPPSFQITAHYLIAQIWFSGPTTKDRRVFDFCCVDLKVKKLLALSINNKHLTKCHPLVRRIACETWSHDDTTTCQNHESAKQCAVSFHEFPWVSWLHCKSSRSLPVSWRFQLRCEQP